TAHTKICEAAELPPLLGKRTSKTLPQVPPVLVSVNCTWVALSLNPPLLSIVRLNTPHPSTMPPGTLVCLNDAVKEPPRLLDSETGPTVKSEALTFKATVDPSPIRY